MTAVPVNIITGALGVGKTTAIARLLGTKPVDEHWVVILNEFTDTGIDTLTLASAACGAYDVRTIPGGCLCCTGEEDFQRQLATLLRSETLPARIVIEPSGIGHPGAVVTELRAYEAQGVLRLMSTIVLVDGNVAQLGTTELEQIGAADVVLLAKADRADDIMRRRFAQWAAGLFPAKRYLGECVAGVMPLEALSPPTRHYSFEVLPRPPLHALARSRAEVSAQAHQHAPEINAVLREVVMGKTLVSAKSLTLLERQACGWHAPASLLFDLEILQRWMTDAPALFQNVERMKAVLRTGIEQWHLLQYWNEQWSCDASAWRQDSRIEVQMCPGAAVAWSGWDSLLRSALVTAQA